MSKAKRAGLLFVFVWFAVGGLGHFVLTPFFVSIVPPVIPWPRAAVLVSGVCELLGAMGLLWLPTRRAAGIGLALLTVAVTPANVYMWQHPALFPGIPPGLLGARLVLQVLLLAGILWSTGRPGERATHPR